MEKATSPVLRWGIVSASSSMEREACSNVYGKERASYVPPWSASTAPKGPLQDRLEDRRSRKRRTMSTVLVVPAQRFTAMLQTFTSQVTNAHEHSHLGSLIDDTRPPVYARDDRNAESKVKAMIGAAIRP